MQNTSKLIYWWRINSIYLVRENLIDNGFEFSALILINIITWFRLYRTLVLSVQIIYTTNTYIYIHMKAIKEL